MTEQRRVVTPERFATGLTYEEYVAQAKANQERFQQTYTETRLSQEDREFFASLRRRLGGPLKVLAIGEEW